MGMGVAAVWMMSGGVRLFFSSGWSLRAITGRHKQVLGVTPQGGTPTACSWGGKAAAQEGLCSEHQGNVGQKTLLENWAVQSSRGMSNRNGIGCQRDQVSMVEESTPKMSPAAPQPSVKHPPAPTLGTSCPLPPSSFSKLLQQRHPTSPDLWLGGEITVRMQSCVSLPASHNPTPSVLQSQA